MAAAERRLSGQTRRRSSSAGFKPIALLKGAKDADNLKELNLASKNICSQKLDGIEAFIALEVLYLESNSLPEVPEALGAVPTLRELNLSSNDITSLEHSCLPQLTGLEKLLLSNNKLKDFDTVLAALAPLPALKELDLTGNPVTETENYREKIIERILSLRVLDGEAIQEETRTAAIEKLHPAEPSQPAIMTARCGRHVTAAVVKNNTSMVSRLKSMLAEIKRTVKAHRILMAPDFTDVDRRKEECVPEPEFIRILDLYGLLPKPKHVERLPTEPGAVLTSVSDLAILLSFYGTEPPKRCKAMGRDKKAQEQYFVNYVAFCRDVEPTCGGRDAQTRERILEEQWNARAPAISDCLRRLRNDVKNIKSRMQEEKDASWRSLTSAGGPPRPRTESCVPWKVKNTSATKLGAWELLELKKLLRAKDPAKTGMLTREEVLTAVKEMETRGRKLVGQDAWAAGKGPVPELEAVLSQLDSRNTGKVAWKDFVNGVDADNGIFARLQWVKLRGAEAIQKSQELFKQAESLQSTLALGAVTGKAAEEMEAQVKSLSQIATRLQRQATETEETEGASIEAPSTSRRSTAHHRRSDSASVPGRKDYVKNVDYLPHRRALSNVPSQESTPGRPSTSSLRERFGLIADVRDKFAIKQQLKAPRVPYSTSITIV